MRTRKGKEKIREQKRAEREKGSKLKWGCNSGPETERRHKTADRWEPKLFLRTREHENEKTSRKNGQNRIVKLYVEAV